MHNDRTTAVLDTIRKKLGYSFPRMGKIAFNALFRMLPAETRVELLPGIWMNADFRDATFQSTYWQGRRFEGNATTRLLNWFRDLKAPVFFDIGSNYGFFSFQIHHAVHDASIYAFEPNPLTFKRLATIVQDNKLLRIIPQPVGLSNESGRFALHHGDKDLGHSTFGAHPDLLASTQSFADVIAFDEWITHQNIAGKLRRPKSWVAKIDVEGFEPRVLAGMEKTLQARTFKGLMVEINPFTLNFNGYSPDDIYSILRRHDYHPLISNSVTGHHGNQFFEAR